MKNIIILLALIISGCTINTEYQCNQVQLNAALESIKTLQMDRTFNTTVNESI